MSHVGLLEHLAAVLWQLMCDACPALGEVLSNLVQRVLPEHLAAVLWQLMCDACPALGEVLPNLVQRVLPEHLAAVTWQLTCVIKWDLQGSNL